MFEKVSLDLDVSGNTPDSISSIDACRVSTVGSVFDIDVVADAIPPFDTSTLEGGVGGVGFDIVYDPSIVKITGRDAGGALLFNQNPPLGFYYDGFSDALPDTDGDYRHDALEINSAHTESGDGVLARLTIEIVGAGVSALDLNDLVEYDGTPLVIDNLGYPYDISEVIDAEIRSDGSQCLDPGGDADGDGVLNSADNCPTQSNPSQTDENADEIGDVCDSVGGEVLITSDTARQSGLPRAWLVGASLLAIGLGTGTLWRLRRR